MQSEERERTEWLLPYNIVQIDRLWQGIRKLSHTHTLIQLYTFSVQTHTAHRNIIMQWQATFIINNIEPAIEQASEQARARARREEAKTENEEIASKLASYMNWNV